MNWASSSSSSLKGSKLSYSLFSSPIWYLHSIISLLSMAEEASSHLTFISIVVLIFIVDFVHVSANPTSPGLLLHSLSVPAMVLPLYHSTPNSRRHLQGSESVLNARMSLYDDLLRNGCVSLSSFLLGFVLELGLKFLWFLWRKVLYDPALDRNAAADVCAYCGYRQHCHLCALLFLWTVWKTPGNVIWIKHSSASAFQFAIFGRDQT